VIRDARIARQKQLGLIPVNFRRLNQLPHKMHHKNMANGMNFQPEQKALEARRMEIYAGMVENLDANIGRVIQYLKRNNLYDNTLIFFVSDNGAEGFVRGSYGSESGFDNSVANVGTPTSYHYIGPRWAEVSAAPFHLWKDTAGEGATTAPAIVKLPNQKKAKETNHSFASVLDVFPTLLDYAHIPVPQGNIKAEPLIRQAVILGSLYLKINHKRYALPISVLLMNCMVVNMQNKVNGKLHFKVALN
jgi:arylsulfatase